MTGGFCYVLACDKLTGMRRMCYELTGDEMTVWQDDCVMCWLVAMCEMQIVNMQKSIFVKTMATRREPHM